MNRKLFITVLLLALPLFAARAQEFDPEHRYGMEVWAGLSPVQTLLEKYQKELPEGSEYVNKIGPAVTASFIFDLNDKWTLQGGLNVSRARYDITTPEGAPFSDHATPTLTFLFNTRYNWLSKPHVRMYSGVGFGMTNKVMLAVFFPSPIPIITLLGINVGTQRIYLSAEVTAGAGSTGGVAGIGLRF